MQANLFTTRTGEKVYLTDEVSTSSHGIPVLVVESAEGVFSLGARDELGPGIPAHFVVQAFFDPRLPAGSTLRRARRTRAAVDACERFLEAALPLVRRTPADGYVAVPFGGVIGK